MGLNLNLKCFISGLSDNFAKLFVVRLFLRFLRFGILHRLIKKTQKYVLSLPTADY